MERSIYDHYGLYVAQRFQAGAYAGFYTEDSTYLFIPEERAALSSWDEKIKWADWLKQAGDAAVASYVAPLYRGTSITIEGEKQRLFRLPAEKRKENHPGAELGAFHQKGHSFYPMYDARDFAGRWAQWWEYRLNQLEDWNEKVREKKESTSLDRFFVQTFPYYMGKTENALQWLQHLQEQANTQESGCITHFCFTPATWIISASDTVPNKLPADWLFDHPARDVAEWIRHAAAEDTSFQDIKQFITEYENYNRLSPFAWQLIAGRLIFPYHYMEQMEQAYIHENTETMHDILLHLQKIWDSEGAWMEQLRQLKQTFPEGFDGFPDWAVGGRDFSV